MSKTTDFYVPDEKQNIASTSSAELVSHASSNSMSVQTNIMTPDALSSTSSNVF